jgi:hypothetical protein
MDAQEYPTMTWHNDMIANRQPRCGVGSRCVMAMTIGATHKFRLSQRLGFPGT